MPMPSSASRAQCWLAGFRSRPVVLSSPYPASQCIRRLAVVTTQRGLTSWHIDPRNAGHPAPRFRGDLGPSRVLVARFEDATGRNSFAPWLDASFEAAATGGATLTGTIGLHPAVRVLGPVIAAVAGLIALGGLAAGIAQLASGHLGGSLPVMLIPLALIAGIAGISAVGLRSLVRQIPKLIQEMKEILGSTAACRPAAVRAADGNDA